MGTIINSIPVEKVNFANKEAKREHDNIIIKALEGHKHLIKNKKVLCLPHRKWIFEQLLNERIPQFKKFTGIETNKTVYNSMASWGRKLNDTSFKLDYFHGTDKDYFDRHTNQFGYIYLDWMGAWGKYKEGSLMKLCQNGLIDKDGSIISFVVMAGREHITLADLNSIDPINFAFTVIPDNNVFGRFPYADYRRYGIPKKFNEIMERYGYTVIPLVLSSYQEIGGKGIGQGHSPQLHFMFYVRKINNGKTRSKKVTYKTCMQNYHNLANSIKSNKRKAEERSMILKFTKKHFKKDFKKKDFNK